MRTRIELHPIALGLMASALALRASGPSTPHKQRWMRRVAAATRKVPAGVFGMELLHPLRPVTLDTTGRCTSRTHSVTLLAALRGDALIATTCMGRGPDWILNLMAEPHADVTTGVSRFPVMATFPTGDDRAAAAAAFADCRNHVVSALLRRLVSDTGGTGPQIVILSPC